MLGHDLLNQPFKNQIEEKIGQAWSKIFPLGYCEEFKSLFKMAWQTVLLLRLLISYFKTYPLSALIFDRSFRGNNFAGENLCNKSKMLCKYWISFIKSNDIYFRVNLVLFWGQVAHHSSFLPCKNRVTQVTRFLHGLLKFHLSKTEVSNCFHCQFSNS